MILFQSIIFENLIQILIYKTTIFTIGISIISNCISSELLLIDTSYENIFFNVISKSM